MTQPLMALVVSLILASVVSAQEATTPWVRVNAQAPWRGRDSSAEVAFQGQLWILGGWFDSFEAPPRDVWHSADGVAWEQATVEAPWKHSDLGMSLVFQDRMWFMGGWYNGRLPGHSASSEVWSSTDGAKWEQATAAAGWSPRIAAASVVFHDQMWILGGTENYYFGDQRSLKNDVWCSADGKDWTCVTDQAQWSPRAYQQAAVLNDRIYVFGGGNYVPEYHAQNDVWSSADGKTWRQESAGAPWHPRLWFSSAVYRDHLWVLGGWTKEPAQNWGDVWYSRDGRDWHEYRSSTVWKERHEHSTYVLHDKLWVVGGHAMPLSNEVWSLELPPDWQGAPPSQPIP